MNGTFSAWPQAMNKNKSNSKLAIETACLMTIVCRGAIHSPTRSQGEPGKAGHNYELAPRCFSPPHDDKLSIPKLNFFFSTVRQTLHFLPTRKDPAAQLFRHFAKPTLVEHLQKCAALECVAADIKRKGDKSIKLILRQIHLDACVDDLLKPVQVLVQQIDGVLLGQAAGILNRLPAN